MEPAPAEREPSVRGSIVDQLAARAVARIEAVGKSVPAESGIREAIREVLYDPELTEEEEAALDPGRRGDAEDGSSDSDGYATVMRSRIERALGAALGLAGIDELPEIPEPQNAPELRGMLEDTLHARARPTDPGNPGVDWIRRTLRRGGDPDDTLVGELFHNKYRILRKIGQGGFGAVYEALDERGAHNRVAIKIMLPGASRTRALLKLFRGEAVRVTRLSHPNIVDWKNFDRTEDGRYYFVMELLEGEELQSILDREGTLEPQRAMRILLNVLDALRAAHFVGEGESILHLDLKPKNIIVLPERTGRGETAKVIDFGIGQYVGNDEFEKTEEREPPEDLPGEASGGGSTFDTLRFAGTRAWEIAELQAACPFKLSHACTPEYASPEQCVHVQFADTREGEPRPLDGRSDLYSFGVVAYQMLTGRLPFSTEGHRHEYLNLHRSESPAPWTSSERKIPGRLRRFVERCLKKHPDERWENTQRAFEELSRIARPPVWRIAVAIAVPLLLGAGALTFAWRGDKPVGGQLIVRPSEKHESTRYLGPERLECTVTLEDRMTGEMPDEDLAPVLLFRGPGELFTSRADWRVSAGESGARTIAVPEGYEVEHLGRETFEVAFGSEEGVPSTPLFQLVWLGRESWERRVELIDSSGGVEWIDGGTQLVDPRGLALRVQVEGEARGEILPPWFRYDDDQGASLLDRQTTGEVVRHSRALGDLELLPGELVWRLEIRDRAGGRRDLTGTWRISTVPLEPGVTIQLLEDEYADAEECATYDRKYCPEWQDRPVLVVRAPREVTLDWRLHWEEQEHPPERSGPSRIHRIPLADALRVLPAGILVEIDLLLTDQVIHGRAEDHQVAGRTLFIHTPENTGPGKCNFELRGDEGEVLYRDPAEPFRTSARELELAITNRARHLLAVEVESTRPGEEPISLVVHGGSIIPPGTALELALPTDVLGHRRIEIRAFRVRREGAPAERDWPVYRTSFALEVDRIPAPRIRAELGGRQTGIMCLVPGNSAEYLFGGRSASLERELYREAGLPRTWSFEVPWALSCKPGRIAPFYLDRAEVTVGEFLVFLRASHRGYRDESLRPPGSGSIDLNRRRELIDRLSYQSPYLPVTGVTWEEATAYAASLGKRLPTLLEFEYALRGGEEYRPYSCYDPALPSSGAERVIHATNSREPRPRSRLSASEYPDRTPETGLFDLSGNVAEWTLSPVRQEPPRSLEPFLPLAWDASASDASFYIAGGSFEYTRFDLTQIEAEARNASRSYVGFRCAVSVDDWKLALRQRPRQGEPRFLEEAAR